MPACSCDFGSFGIGVKPRLRRDSEDVTLDVGELVKASYARVVDTDMILSVGFNSDLR